MKTATAPKSKRRPADVSAPIRVLTAVPICDGHDSAINTINLEFIRQGIEVIYLGYHRSARDIVRAAIQEDVRAIGISSYNGGHVEFFIEVVDLLKAQGAGDIAVFGGGGGTITEDDAKIMHARGVDAIFPPGTSLESITKYVKENYGTSPKRKASGRNLDRAISNYLSGGDAPKTVAWAPRPRANNNGRAGKSSTPRVIGITGPGGAGKTTLIDELVLRYLRLRDDLRVAILSHDPSIVGNGALLGDRATMIYSQDDRVYMRSLATRGQAGGLSADTETYLKRLRALPFDVILVETVGTGQEAMPFRDGLVERSVFVMSPEYGSKLQLQKIAMLDLADVVVVNKSDLAGAPRASAEVEQRLQMNHRDQRVLTTCAKKHRDPGVDQLFQLLQNG
jgi:methylmalonyl-CoA mutase